MNTYQEKVELSYQLDKMEERKKETLEEID